METPPTFSAQQLPPIQVPPAYRVRLAAIGEAWRIIWKDVWPWVILMFLLMVSTSIFQVPIQFAIQFSMMPGLMQSGARGSRSPADAFQALDLSPGMLAGLVILGIGVIGIQGFVNTLPQRFTLRKLREWPATVNDMFSFDGASGRVAAWWVLFPLLAGLIPAVLMISAVLASGGFSSRPDNIVLSPVFWIAYGTSILWFLAAQTLFAFVPLLIVDQGLSVVDAARLSAKTLAPHVLPMLGVVYICAALLSVLGVCACYVGFFVTGCLQQATIGVVYNDFFRRVEQPREETASAYPRPQW